MSFIHALFVAKGVTMPLSPSLALALIALALLGIMLLCLHCAVRVSLWRFDKE